MTAAPGWEPTAARIRARAAAILRELPVEDPHVVWARRAVLLAEVDGTPPTAVAKPRMQRGGIWRWPR